MFFNPKDEFTIFYGGRRSFLSGETETKKTLEPPIDYKNKRQMRKTLTVSSTALGSRNAKVKVEQEQNFNLVAVLE